MIDRIAILSATLLLITIASPQRDRFSKYKPVEAYEVRPDILMMPRYSEDGQVCEIGLQRRLYSPEVVRLDREFSREEIERIIDELVPLSERGQRPDGLMQRGGINTSGIGMVAREEYENVSIRTYSKVLSESKKHGIEISDEVATITWKNRKCKD